MTTGSLRRRPLADEVVRSLADLIRDDGLDEGDDLPPISTLAERLGVSRTVTREAVAMLAETGTVRRTDGRRWTVLAVPGDRDRASHDDDGDPVRFRSLADQAADAVLKMIVDRELAEGDPLPSSGELARTYGVSVLVIREALAGLSSLGVLQRRQGRESVVAAPSSDILSSVLRVWAHLEGIEVDEFLVARASLETRAAALAAAAPDAARKREALDVPLHGMRRARSERDFNDHDVAFHIAVASLSGNRAIALVLEAMHEVIRSFMDVTYRRAHTRDRRAVEIALGHHEDIAAAIVAGDPEAAAEAMTTHFAFSR
ncbi:MAG TPA: GntR family transcriptional regulator [Actinomycetota bacterium]|nr:GntR family transcriptional regulator [Actinomycetota bacterium]